MHVVRALVAAALAAASLAPPAAAGQTLVRGLLLDAEGDAPVESGTVVISANRGRWQRAVQTDSAGAFAFQDVAPGPYRLRASRVGYRPIVGEMGVGADSVVEVVMRLARQTVVLEPVTVVTRAQRRVSPQLQGFFARMQHGVGRFITREEIESRHPVRVTDLLRNLPNLRPNPPRSGAGGSTMTMGTTGDRCSVVFFVDRMRVNQPMVGGGRGGLAIDDYVQPDEIVGIEIYRGESDTPAEFVTRWVQCGTVVIWTRRGR